MKTKVGNELERLSDGQSAPCEECGQRFLTADALERHFRERHIPWPLPEIEVGESFDAWKERVRSIKKQQEGRAADEDTNHA